MARSTRNRAWVMALAIVCLIGIGASPSLVQAQSGDNLNRAKAHYKAGVSFFQAGDYRAAITEFSAADRLAPSPLLDYNMGLCHERLGETADALRRFRAYRTRAPNAANRAEVDAKIARLESALAAAKPAPDPVPDPIPDPDPNTAPTTDPNVDPNTTPDPDPNANLNTNPTTDPATDPAAAPTYPKTGDAALDRVAAINLDQVAGRHPAVTAPNAAPPAPAGSMGQTGQTGQTGGNGVAPVGPPDQPDKPKPIYKKWWFWVVVGVSALILIDIASSDSDSPSANGRVQGILLDPGLSTGSGSSGGFTIRF